ncbi:MAG: phosphatase PAP2 family protein [Lachnospiraceae bacterium]|jgi:membrane-associated phospholipid phosphatase
MGIEIQILDWMQNIRTPFGDIIVPLISGLGNAGIIWIALTLVLLVIPKTRRSGLIMALALIADLILCNGILKNLVARTRPYDVNTVVNLLIEKPVDYSFPSGHTAASFAAVTALYLAGEKKLWKPALVLSILIAFTRMYLYVHYPTDILGGIAVGIISGYIGFFIAGRK